MTQPAKLSKGDQVAILAPAAPCEPSRLESAVRAVEDMGLRPHVMKSCRSQNGFLAGSDALRAGDIMDAFEDSEIKGIFALRGGYGTQRLLPMLDYELIARNPKIFCGYSDITALHTVFNQFCKFVSFHAPMPATELCQPELDRYTLDSFLASVMEGAGKAPKLSYKPITEGSAKGILTGGNLSLLASSLGTPYEINTDKKILFIEEINEDPYRVDRMLLQLKLAGKFKNCRGIILGSFAPETAESLAQPIEELLVPLGVPIGVDLACGHCMPTATLALGAEMRMGLGELVWAKV